MLNMKKQYRAEIRELKKKNRATSDEFNAAIRSIRTLRYQLIRQEAVTRRIMLKRVDRNNRRIAILEGRLW